MWVKHIEDTNMPEWLKSNLESNCKICGSEMLNYYNEDNRCTFRKCSNPYCPGMIATRADNIRQLIGVKGLGYAGLLDIVRKYDIKRPIDILPFLNIQPTVSIGMFLRMQCWEGVDSALETEMQQNGITDLDTLLNSYNGKYKSYIDKYKQDLIETSKYVKLPEKAKHKSQVSYTIMITGTPIGFNSKEHFIQYMNNMTQGLITTIHQPTKRQSNVDCLIREPGSTTRGKYEAALKAGIPIMTSKEYINEIINGLSYLTDRETEDILNDIKECGHILLK